MIVAEDDSRGLVRAKFKAFALSYDFAVTKIATPKGPKPTGQAYLDQQAQQSHDKGGR